MTCNYCGQDETTDTPCSECNGARVWKHVCILHDGQPCDAKECDAPKTRRSGELPSQAALEAFIVSQSEKMMREGRPVKEAYWAIMRPNEPPPVYSRKEIHRRHPIMHVWLHEPSADAFSCFCGDMVSCEAIRAKGCLEHRGYPCLCGPS